MNIVGLIKFDGKNMCVYDDLNNPKFKIKDVAYFIRYSGNIDYLESLCEKDEIEHVYDDFIKCYVTYINESGLYNVLSQLRDETSRKWRRIIFHELIEIRKEKQRTIIEQFDEWDNALDNIYWDDEKKMLMESVTLPGGDVEQRPYRP